MKKAIAILLSGLWLFLGAGIWTALPLQIASAASCRTFTNIRAVNEGGGSWNDRRYFLYVYGTTDNRGTAYYYYAGGMLNGWVNTGWRAVSLLPKNAGIKIGVSTWWAYTHPDWMYKTYKYLLCT